MGWLTPVELVDAAAVTEVAALEDEPKAWLIRNDGAENEYYIIENRQQKGWDKQLPGSGILVSHVDYDKAVWEFSAPNSSSKKRYSIFPANNKARTWSASGWAYPYIVTDYEGNATVANDCLTDTSAPAATLNNPNADGEYLMSKPITQMAVDADGLASFVFLDDVATTVSGLPEGRNNSQLSALKSHWYTLDGRRLSGKPATKGLYIYNGNKVAIK